MASESALEKLQSTPSSTVSETSASTSFAGEKLNPSTEAAILQSVKQQHAPSSAKKVVNLALVLIRTLSVSFDMLIVAFT
tara:strand:- start:70 stop:309 length:240 start_codon:yes stop_codon:yes gene_type:complete